jgi:hypothetical protein
MTTQGRSRVVATGRALCHAPRRGWHFNAEALLDHSRLRARRNRPKSRPPLAPARVWALTGAMNVFAEVVRADIRDAM